MNATKRLTTIALTALATALAAGAAHARHSRLDGNLTIVNERSSPVEVQVDGERLGRVAPGAKRQFHNIPNGVRLVEIEGRGPDPVRQISVPVGGTAFVRVEALLGGLAVTNKATIPMRVALNGRALGTAAPGQTLRADGLKPGPHRLVARPAASRFGRVEALDEVVDVRAGKDAHAAIAPYLASVRVTNPSGQRAALRVDGRREDRLRPGETELISGLEPGRHTIELVHRGHVIDRTTLHLAPGQRAEWRPVDRRRGDIRVSNTGRLPLTIEIDGRVVERRLDPGEVEIVRDLTPGTHIVTVIGPRGRATRHRVTVQGAATEDLVVGVGPHPARRPGFVARP